MGQLACVFLQPEERGFGWLLLVPGRPRPAGAAGQAGTRTDRRERGEAWRGPCSSFWTQQPWQRWRGGLGELFWPGTLAGESGVVLGEPPGTRGGVGWASLSGSCSVGGWGCGLWAG